MVSEEELKNMSPDEIRTLQEQNCIFCKIGKKEIPANVIYEDDYVIAFLDIQPLTMGHVILTTKKHNVFFSQVSDDETGHLFKVAKQISQCLIKALQVKGTNIFIANGEFAGQLAPHFIMHIIPRKQEKDLPVFHPVKEDYNDADLFKIQSILVSRIEEVMKVDVKSKIEARKLKLHPELKEKKESAEEKPPTEEKKIEETSKAKNEDIDLDKISELFK